MYSLEILKSESFQNRKAPGGNFDRDCSFHVTRSGLILHSAVHRNTLFVSRETPDFTPLHRYLSKASQRRANACIEAYFSDTIPTVHAAIAAARSVR